MKKGLFSSQTYFYMRNSLTDGCLICSCLICSCLIDGCLICSCLSYNCLIDTSSWNLTKKTLREINNQCRG